MGLLTEKDKKEIQDALEEYCRKSARFHHNLDNCFSCIYRNNSYGIIICEHPNRSIYLNDRIIPKGWIWQDELPISLGDNYYYVKPESDPYGFFDYFNEIWGKFWNENS